MIGLKGLIHRISLVLVLGTTIVSAASCRSARGGSAPAIVQPGAPGQAERQDAADMQFMQGMIGHHAQALEMTALLRSRTRSEDMKKLAERIEVSQEDEIRMMREWLGERGQKQPDPHAHHAAGARLMPGMLTPQEMARLAAAEGPAFDRLFLEYMIKHHEGALTMVKELFATPGAGQESEIFAFASDVDADQRMEIDRMAAMLASLTTSKERSR